MFEYAPVFGGRGQSVAKRHGPVDEATLGRAKVILDSGSQHAGAVTASGNFKMCVVVTTLPGLTL